MPNPPFKNSGDRAAVPDIAPGEYHLISGRAVPLEFDPERVEMLGVLSEEAPAAFPRVSRRGFYSYMDTERGLVNLQVVSFPYDPSGRPETKHTLVIWTGNGEHSVPTGPVPIKSLVGVHIGTYDPTDHSYDLLYAEPTKIEVQHFSLDSIISGRLP